MSRGHGIADCLEGQAAIAAAEGRYDEAARLLGEAEQARLDAGPEAWDVLKRLPLPAREEWFARMREELARRV